MKLKTVVVILLLVIIFSNASIPFGWGKDDQEDVIVKGDLEGPDEIPPPKYYRTLEMMLEEAQMLDDAQVCGPPPVVVTGTREILVLLVELSDVAHDAAHTVAHFDGRFFNTTPPSVRDFYFNNSYGLFTYVPGAVMGWYTSTRTQAQYLALNGHVPVFQEAIGDVDPFFNFGPYDTDNNGVVENEELTLFMIVSGDQGGAFHTWNRPNVATADTNGLGNPVSVEGEYSVTHEERHIGSYCHELGHDLGLPDLYDTDPWNGNTVTGLSEGIGNFGLMGGGSWTFSHLTAWSKIQLGWITPTIITTNGYYTINDAETHAEAYILIDPGHSNDEYFLIENRHPANSFYETVGWPVAPSGTYPDSGIIIYHIDETRMLDWFTSGTNNVNRDETHKGVDVECADSQTSHVVNADDLDDLTNRGDANDLWDNGEYDFHDTSNPCNANWYGTIVSGMDVRALPAPAPAMTVALSIVDDWPPEAEANGPYLGTEGTPVTFDGSGSSDLNGIITTYEWDLDDDGDYDDATGVAPSYTWGDEYSGTIGLKVTDDEGLSDTDSTTVTIENVAPTVDAGSDQTVNEGDTVDFFGSFTDPGWLDTHTAAWDWGDGSPPEAGTVTEENVAPDSTGTVAGSHSYGDNGVYTVTLTVTDDDGGVGTDTLTVTVYNVAPSISSLGMASPNPDNPEFVLPTVHEPLFTGVASDPGSDDLTFTWYWGDGTDDTTIYYNDGVGPDPYPSPGPTYPFSEVDELGHTYSEPGTYTVTLSVEDDDGGVVVDTMEVIVLSAEEAKEIINDYIQGLPDDAFKEKPEQRKKAFNNMFSALNNKLANEEYRGVIMDLMHNIRQKADGHVDGSLKNDWIVNPTAQEHICWKIDALIAYLETLL